MLTVGVGIGTWAMLRSMRVAPGARATVQTVNGILYQVADNSSTPVFSGRELGDRQLVRTAKESTAMLRLSDGSMVEMNERSQVSITRASRGTTILLDRGNVIVHAAKQRTGALYVKTADCEVSVKGTIFAVTSGTKGSRVSVVEGSVKVDQANHSQMLKPGDQATTDASVEKVPVQDEIAWSRDATKYLAILGELSGLQKEIERIPGPGQRTSSRLLDLAPPNTVLYAAIPNIGATLGQANQLFQERIQASPILKQWWEQQGNHGAQLQEMVQKIQNMSGYLGDEIVLAYSAESDSKSGSPIILAEAKRPGLRELLQAEIAAVNAKSAKQTIEMVDNPAQLRSVATESHTAKVYVGDGIVALTPQGSLLQDLSVRMKQPQEAESFTNSGFHDRIQQAYSSGVSWLFCANLDQMRNMGQRFNRRETRAMNEATGMSGVRYLILERKDVNGQTKNQATLAFSGQRQGLASWLAAPGPMSTLDFVSPDASLAGSFVIKNPGAMLSELIHQAEAKNPELQQKLDEIQSQTGVNLIHDLADPLGGELTVAIDGPLLPVPSWKLAVEVYSPDRLEWAIEKLVDAFNKQSTEGVKLQLTKSQEGARTFYTLKPIGANVPLNAEIDYVFVDSYLLAAANRGLLNTAIQNRSTGYTLARSSKFRNLLPQDANSNFSAIVYHNVGGLVGPLADGLKSLSAVSAEQKQAIEKLQANTAPGLIYGYGEPDKITISANGSLFGFSLDTLALPKVLENMMRHKP